MSTKIEELYDQNSFDILTAVVGLGHFLSLRKALRHLKPKAYTLAEYENV